MPLKRCETKIFVVYYYDTIGQVLKFIYME